MPTECLATEESKLVKMSTQLRKIKLQDTKLVRDITTFNCKTIDEMLTCQ